MVAVLAHFGGYFAQYAAAIILTLLTTAALRLALVLPSHRAPPRKRARGTPTHLLLVLGSGGHTAEMLKMLQHLNAKNYTHRTYIVSSGDEFSANRAKSFEASLNNYGDGIYEAERPTHANAQMHRSNGSNASSWNQFANTVRQSEAAVAARERQEAEENPQPAQTALMRDTYKQTGSDGTRRIVKSFSTVYNEEHGSPPDHSNPSTFSVETIPRARRIHQSLLTTPFSALNCLLVCLRLLSKQPQADLIVTNGPGTGAIVVLAALILRYFNIRGANRNDKFRSIYVESWARVTRLSLTGRLVRLIVDRFLVQWEELRDKYDDGKVEFQGILV